MHALARNCLSTLHTQRQTFSVATQHISRRRRRVTLIMPSQYVYYVNCPGVGYLLAYLLTPSAQYAVQGLCNGRMSVRPSVCLSVCPVDSSCLSIDIWRRRQTARACGPRQCCDPRRIDADLLKQKCETTTACDKRELRCWRQLAGGHTARLRTHLRTSTSDGRTITNIFMVARSMQYNSDPTIKLGLCFPAVIYIAFVKVRTHTQTQSMHGDGAGRG